MTLITGPKGKLDFHGTYNWLKGQARSITQSMIVSEWFQHTGHNSYSHSTYDWPKGQAIFLWHLCLAQRPSYISLALISAPKSKLCSLYFTRIAPERFQHVCIMQSFSSGYQLRVALPGSREAASGLHSGARLFHRSTTLKIRADNVSYLAWLRESGHRVTTRHGGNALTTATRYRGTIL